MNTCGWLIQDDIPQNVRRKLSDEGASFSDEEDLSVTEDADFTAKNDFLDGAP